MNKINMNDTNKRIAVVFPGQGSQSVGMLSQFADSEIVRETFHEASMALDLDLWDLIQKDPDNKLNQTEYTQPALLTASVALWRVWQHQQEMHKLEMQGPIVLAGHSLGEYSALVCAQAISLTDAVKWVRERGRAMQSAVPAGQGAMAAILGVDDEPIVQLCTEICKSNPPTKVLSPANYNCPGQVVIAGDAELVEQAIQKAKDIGAKKAVILPVSVPSHCNLMNSAAQVLGQMIKQQLSIAKPGIPVIHNVDVNSYADPDQIQAALIKQLTQPVRWVETILKMQSMGVEIILECGPGNVLTSLNKRIAPSLQCQSLQALLLEEQICL